MQPVLRSSGDLIADRRYEHALAYAKAGEFAAAAELFAQVLERAPDWMVAWLALAETEEACGRKAEAIAAYEQAAALDMHDELGARLHLARLGIAPPPERAAEAYISGLFDHYSATFEDHLVDALSYRGPAQLADAVRRQTTQSFAHVIDLGCGTGLCGAVFRDKAGFLTGVDLSARMVARARAKALYDALYIESVGQFLDTAPSASADLLLAADVFVYIGDLDPILREGARVLRADGLFAFTLQKRTTADAEAQGFSIGADLRYAHDPEYVMALTASRGYALVEMQDEWARRERGIGVPGLVVLLRRC